MNGCKCLHCQVTKPLQRIAEGKNMSDEDRLTIYRALNHITHLEFENDGLKHELSEAKKAQFKS